MFVDNGRPACRLALSRGMYALVDPEDYDRLVVFNYYFLNGYAMRTVVVNGKRQPRKLHADVLQIPVGLQFVQIGDHIDGLRTLDNRKYNLRVATMMQNAANRRTRKDNKLGAKGIRQKTAGGKYEARLMAAGKSYFLGTFVTLAEAVKARNTAARELHGEFASQQ